MRLSLWPDGSCPIFLNPSIDEIKELVDETLDTVRICDEEENDRLALASGYGNTHDSVMKAAKKEWPNFFPIDLILVCKENWYWNHLGHWNTRREYVSFEEGLRCVSPRLKQVAQDIRAFAQQ